MGDSAADVVDLAEVAGDFQEAQVEVDMVEEEAVVSHEEVPQDQDFQDKTKTAEVADPISQLQDWWKIVKKTSEDNLISDTLDLWILLPRKLLF